MRHTLDFLKQLAHGLAIQFGSSCEIAIHDLKTKDLERSIVYIENGTCIEPTDRRWSFRNCS